MSSLLSVSGLCMRFGGLLAVDSVGFDVGKDEVFAIIGPNGAGKTTVFNCVGGFYKPTSGSVMLDGQPIHGLASHNVAQKGLVRTFQNVRLFKKLTVLENLAFLCGLHGRREGQAIGPALEVAGMAGYEDAPARQLSAGQKKRVTLARLWLSPAPLWLLDEPYANLDLEGINLVNRMISAHLRGGGAALVTTHGAYAAPPVRTRMLELGATA